MLKLHLAGSCEVSEGVLLLDLSLPPPCAVTETISLNAVNSVYCTL